MQFNKTSTNRGSEIHTVPFGDSGTFYDTLFISNNGGRSGTVTRMKSKAVKYIIKVL